MPEHAMFVEHSASFIRAYLLLGHLEIEFRRSVPQILLSKTPCGNQWHSTLKLKSYGQSDLRAAQTKNATNPEYFLTFGFWRNLLTKAHYGDLWLPALHHIFPALESPKKIQQFMRVDRALHSTHRLRNNIAHFNLESAPHIPAQIKKLEWLFEMMEIVPNQLNPRDL